MTVLAHLPTSTAKVISTTLETALDTHLKLTWLAPLGYVAPQPPSWTLWNPRIQLH